ncbi:hypothetical protein ACFLV7_01270 [Chloroflexota bacterium]
MPTIQEVLPVFSIIMFFVFTWTLYTMFYYLPSWLGDMYSKDILILSTYVFTFALLESLVVLGGMVLLALVLPARFFKDQFVAQGGFFAVLVSLAAYLIHPKLVDALPLRLLYLVQIPIIALAGIIILMVLLSFLFDRLPGFTRVVNAFVEGMTIFAYIYLPLGLLSLFVVLLRIIF